MKKQILFIITSPILGFFFACATLVFFAFFKHDHVAIDLCSVPEHWILLHDA